MNGRDHSGQIEPRRATRIPAQAQVAAWARGARVRRAAGPPASLGRPMCCAKWAAGRFVLLAGPKCTVKNFQEIAFSWKMINGSKKIRKENFSVGKIHSIKLMFPLQS